MGRQRERRLNLYLFDEEYAILDAKADELQMSKSEYVRNIILFGTAFPKTVFNDEIGQKLIYEINRIGNNLNQITLKVNTYNNFDDTNYKELYHLYMELLGVLDDLVRGKI